jgi:TonB-dependent receptor
VKKIILLWVFVVSVLAAQTGELSFFVMQEGKPLGGQHLVVYKQNGTFVKVGEFVSDGDGYFYTKLEEGNYQLRLVATKEGEAQVFVRKNFVIQAQKESQLILALDADKSVSFEDDETPVAIQEDQNTTKSVAKGFIGISLASTENQKPIEKARIFVKGMSLELATDKNGYVEAELPEGAHTLSIIHGDFSSQTIQVQVIAKELTSKTVELSPASMELEEFVVLAPKVEGSIASVMAEEKASNSIANFVGSEQMSKQGDSNAAAALRRVTGVTLVGGKNIYVRGLGDRYSNIELNSMPLPSPNPLKRVVPLDIFPSNVIGSMKVQKSATADIPSSFGGGYVDIRTKSKSDEDMFKITIELKANDHTGKEALTYKGGDSDVLGFDDGYREIPASVLNNSQISVGERVQSFTTTYFTKEELSAFTQQMAQRDYSVTKENLPVGYKATLEGGYTFEIDDEQELSVFANYSYDQDHKYREEKYSTYEMNTVTGALYSDPQQYGDIIRTQSQYRHAGIFNLAYDYEDLFNLKYTKLYTHNADKTTRIVDGIMGSNDEDMTKYYLDWEERTLDVDQLNGIVYYPLFDQTADLSFGAEQAIAKLYQPNNYQYTYLNEGEPFLNNKISNNISNKLESDDDLFAMYIKNKFNFELLGEEEYLDIGYSMNSKTRESRQNKYYLRKMGTSDVEDTELTGPIEGIYDEYVRADIPYDDRTFIVNSLFQAADYFDAEVDESAIYANLFLKPIEALEILVGARQVDFKQVVYQYAVDSTNPDMSQRRLIQRFAEELSIDELYPSLSVKYKFDDNNHIDFAYSQTYIVPDLREFTSGEYFHPYEVATIMGNPELVNTDITSYDLKYSHYFSDTENITLGLFYKQLDNPIEDVMIPSSSLPIYSFDNSDTAVLQGFEIDGRKNFSFLSDLLENYYIAGNFSYTDSEVTLKDEQITIYSTNKRQLQGLSKTVVNLALGYDNDGRSVVVSYNKMGERIRKVGMIDDGIAFPDYYETPPAILDFVWIEKIGDAFAMRVKIGNILNEKTVWKQGDNVTNEYKESTTYSLSGSYKF